MSNENVFGFDMFFDVFLPVWSGEHQDALAKLLDITNEHELAKKSQLLVCYLLSKMEKPRKEVFLSVFNMMVSTVMSYGCFSDGQNCAIIDCVVKAFVQWDAFLCLDMVRTKREDDRLTEDQQEKLFFLEEQISVVMVEEF